MAYQQVGLSGVIGHTVNMGQLDAYTVAVTFGILPNTQAGRDAFDAAHTAVTRGGRHALQRSNPKLAALLASWMGTVMASELGWDDRRLLDNMLLVNDTVANGDEVMGIWSDLWGTDPPGTYGGDPSSPGARYIAAVNQFVGLFFNMAGAVADFGSQPNPGAQAMMQVNAALARGTTRLVTGNAQGYLDVATEFITAGPTTLPDGNVYTVINDPLRVAAGERPTDYVVWGHGPNWTPARVSFPTAGPDSPDPLGRNPWYHNLLTNTVSQLPDPGTGSWYIEGVMGEANVAFPPVGWTGSYILPARVMASLQVGGQAPGVPLPVPQPVTPTIPTPLQPVPVAGGSGGGLVLRQPVNPVTDTPVVVDQGGNVIPAPLVEIHTLPVQSPLGPIQAVAPMSPLLVVGALAAVVFFLSKQK